MHLAFNRIQIFNSCKIFVTPSNVIIHVFIVARRLLYWTETQSDGRGRLMRCRMDGSELRTVLRHRRRPRSTSSSWCSCPSELSVAPSFAVDHTRPVILYVADRVTGNIWSADEQGCHCQLVVNATTLSLTPSHIGQYMQIGLLQLYNESYLVITVNRQHSVSYFSITGQ